MPSILGKIGHIGKNGVQLFFLLSAYLTFKSYAHYICEVDNTIKNNVIWFMNKLIRLLPMYYLVLIICGVYFSFTDENYLSIGNVLTHITFTFGFFPRYCNTIIGVEWYIGTLVIFYMFLPFLFKLISSFEKSLMWVILGGYICYTLSFMGEKLIEVLGRGNDYDYVSYFGRFWIVKQLPILLLGIMMYYLFESKILNQIKYKKFIALSILVSEQKL